MNPDLPSLDLQPLRDIHDALGNPWWPLAPGWWLLLALVAGIVALIWHYRRARPILPAIPLLQIGDWRWDARRQLHRLRRAPRDAALKTRLAELSELLKRIAMARHGRSTCAGLHGQAWLDWLCEQDPDGFDWRQQGQLLIHAPYAPDLLGSGSARRLERQLEQLIAATERWITAPRKQPKRQNEARQGQSGERPISQPGGAFGKLTKAYQRLATACHRRKPPAETA
ncbi:MAG: DUF4381 domain-containing protein [Lamprobacter sp.]|uniref:DUF4381 domain-containing protein n=1 Tax=Lamprobacter sp. TaxID=3100796 RepID=UPI002B2617B9|nr:DUF4381 domain-containing protein [Lamprobacter sp.]MEA3641559.1 DUF4381 domain-containing protein [Lamprobacter sp.]